MGLAIKIRLKMPQDLYKNSIKCLQHNFETMQQETVSQEDMENQVVVS